MNLFLVLLQNILIKWKLYKPQKEVCFALGIKLFLFLSKLSNRYLLYQKNIYVFCKKKFVFQEVLLHYCFLYVHFLLWLIVMLLLFINDPRNIICNFRVLATILLIRNQFRTMYVSFDSFQCAS